MSERTRERIGHGAKGPGSEWARVLLPDSLLGENWPGSEKAVNRAIDHVEVLRSSEKPMFAAVSVLGHFGPSFDHRITIFGKILVCGNHVKPIYL